LSYLREYRMMNPETPDISRQLSVLADANIPYLIINELWAFPWEKENWRTYITYEPLYSDRHISVYRTDPKAGRDFQITQEMTDGVGLTQVISSTDFIGPNTLMETAVMWGTSTGQSKDLRAELALIDEAGQPQQKVSFSPVANWPMSKWTADALGRGDYAFTVDPRLPGGTYTLTLSLINPDTGERVGERTTLREGLKMRMPPRVFERPEMEISLNAQFGDVLRLLGFDAETDGQTFTIDLHWQAVRRMDESFKVFVHVYDTETGEIVAQKDAVPHDWTYPTNWWEAGEIVTDHARLDVGDLAPGPYNLAVGVYDAETRMRLSVEAYPSNIVVDDRRLFLSGGPSP